MKNTSRTNGSKKSSSRQSHSSHQKPSNSKKNKFLLKFVNLFEKGVSKKVFCCTLIVATLLICVGVLYSPAKTFYLTTRENDKLQAQYQSLKETNEGLQKEINYLQTEEGIKDRASSKLGLIENGQSLGSVNGLSSQQTETSNGVNETSSRLKYKQVKSPEKWYTGICDFIFGVPKDK